MFVAGAQFVYRDQPNPDGLYVVLFLADGEVRLLPGKELEPYRIGMLPQSKNQTVSC